MPRRKRTRLHPVLAAIKKRQREIASLVATAKMLGIDLAEIMPSSEMRGAKRMTPEKAAAYYQHLSGVMQEPL